VHLQPMTWRDDWPVMGEHHDRQGVGEPVTIARKPVTGKKRASERIGYGETSLPPGGEWQWQANPQRGWFSADGETWRLSCVTSPRGATLWNAAHLLMRKFEGPAFVATTTLQLHAVADGDCAGLVIFGYDYAWLGLQREHGGARLGLHVCHAANEGAAERCVATVDFVGTEVQLRVAVDETARCQFFVRADGKWEPVGPPFQARSSMWVGAKVGLFASAAKLSPQAHAEFRHFDLRVVGVERI
jgi:beta-xylosidase